METGGEIIEPSVDTERDRTGYNVDTKKKRKISSQRGDKGKIKINSQVVHRYITRIRNGTTERRKDDINTNNKMTM